MAAVLVHGQVMLRLAFSQLSDRVDLGMRATGGER
jgi:hypothetical protein